MFKCYTINMRFYHGNLYIKTDKNLKTDIPFIYACGDTINKEVYQIVTATGEGAVSAISFINDYNS